MICAIFMICIPLLSVTFVMYFNETFIIIIIIVIIIIIIIIIIIKAVCQVLKNRRGCHARMPSLHWPLWGGMDHQD